MASSTESFDAIVLGAGGAGLMCAAVAGRSGARVVVVDHADEPGRKILISGGGRCNFTNLHTSADRYVSANPHFAKSALGRYTPAMFVAMVERHGIAWHEKTLGQLFCDGSARQILSMLLDECAQSGVRLALGQPIASVDHESGHFTVRLADRTLHGTKLVIATGGPSIPKLGATGVAYDLARQFGLKVVEPRPALVPLTLGEDQRLFRSLAGVATDVVARCGAAEFREAALFTHRGLSGPAILQVSTYWRHGDAIAIDFLPAAPSDWLLQAKRQQPRATLQASLAQRLPARLAQALTQRLLDVPAPAPGAASVAGTTQIAAAPPLLAGLPDRDLVVMSERLANWPFEPRGTEGFAKAEVTVGGIATDGLSSQTMEARRVSGLFAIGEAVDVTGWLGGYNFQWAWASGWAAGQAIARHVVAAPDA